MSAAVLRLKRKASCEPIEGLVIALKKSKCVEDLNPNEVYFKFATTIKSENESLKDQIQAVLSKEKESKFFKWRNPKSTAVNQRNVPNICEKLRNESKAASEKKRLDHLNNRRLIFTEFLSFGDQDSSLPSADVREQFHLYDIIEENEEPKKQQIGGSDSAITCNGTPLIREKATEYVYDVYIADGQIDKSFVENAVSLRPCTSAKEDICFEGSDDDSEIYEDEDDSNDENNWRNDYPEDENSHSENASENEYFSNDEDLYYDEIRQSFSHAKLEDGSCSSDDEDFNYFKILDDVENNCSD